MTKAIQRSTSALPSVEKARGLLAHARSTHEVKKIRAVAQAVATLERGKEIAIDAGEIVLLADVRIGELTKEMQKAAPKAGPGRSNKTKSASPTAFSKTAQLAAEGISKQQAAECERIAELAATGGLDHYMKACRKAGQAPTASGAIALAKLTPPNRKEALAKLKDVPDVRRAISEVRHAERVEKLAAISAGNAPIDTKQRYPIILADPPWRYEQASTESRAIENHYPTMDLDAICALPVVDLATDDAVLFMWTTSPKLEESLRVVAAWGFTYRTCAIWDKEKIGMGYFFRQQHELLLVAVRGAPPHPAPSDRVSSVIRSKRSSKHSAKPAESYEIIEAMYPKLPKVELFCRAARDGWGAWGNQS